MSASTGVAAVHVNGCTFHSFLGCGLGGLKDWEKVKFQKSKREAALGQWWLNQHRELLEGSRKIDGDKLGTRHSWLEGSDFQVSRASCCGQCSVLHVLG